VSESLIQRDIRLAIGSRPDTRLFRNNTAQGVVGEVEWPKAPKTVKVYPGDAIVRHARVLHAGLHEGSSDLVGIHRTLITPSMVGRSVGLFLGLETKDERGRASEPQKRWHQMLLDFGALSGIVRSVEEARQVIEGDLTKG